MKSESACDNVIANWQLMQATQTTVIGVVYRISFYNLSNQWSDWTFKLGWGYKCYASHII